MLHPAIVAMVVEMPATPPVRVGAATAMAVVVAAVAVERMRQPVAMAVTRATLKAVATFLRVAQMQSAVVVVAGQDRKPRHAPRAVHPARHRCQISNKAMGALRGGEAQHRSHARVSDLEH